MAYGLMRKRELCVLCYNGIIGSSLDEDLRTTVEPSL
ncbi:uncharacterized protein CLUP02_00388 [Colletotrichum lupini]|uniref:Uncharacterized protein n=1 Tax=Colletotrichum lupini TaxID=145971 RepID=A0A9Q8SC11_9PEZI|nr:uncharacterized protein CLUP02_00388 [Colletotrichum lupini]UQC73742.1 hypothetical protein CLUP02_00388 [Colletotrichum lupini]